MEKSKSSTCQGLAVLIYRQGVFWCRSNRLVFLRWLDLYVLTIFHKLSSPRLYSSLQLIFYRLEMIDKRVAPSYLCFWDLSKAEDQSILTQKSLVTKHALFLSLLSSNLHLQCSICLYGPWSLNDRSLPWDCKGQCRSLDEDEGESRQVVWFWPSRRVERDRSF